MHSIIAAILLITFSIHAQDDSLTLAVIAEMEAAVEKLPDFPVSKSRETVDLPSYVNNAERKEFPPIFRQVGPTCVAAAVVGYQFTYFLNCAYDRDGSLPENQLSHLYAYNLTNGGLGRDPASEPTLMTTMYQNGCMSNADFGTSTAYNYHPSGFEKYRRALVNSSGVVNGWKINVEDMSGIDIARQWLFSKNGSEHGGLIRGRGDYTGYTLEKMTSGRAAGKYYMRGFGNDNRNHAVTYVGYDDSACFDVNGDGLFTTDIDVTGDGMVTLADREWGAFIMANSWGERWANDGFVYIPYRLSGVDLADSGNAYTDSYGKKYSYFPVYEMQQKAEISGVFEITYSTQSRNSITHLSGFSSGAEQVAPTVCDTFRSPGVRSGDFPATGTDSTITIALNATEFLDRVTSDRATLFWGMRVNSGFSATIHSVKLHDYRTADSVVLTASDYPTTVSDTTIWVPFTCVSNESKILNLVAEELSATPAERITKQISASGGTPPYSYTLDPAWYSFGKPLKPIPTEFEHEAQNGLFMGLYNSCETFDLIDPIPFFVKYQNTLVLHNNGHISMMDKGLDYQPKKFDKFKLERIISPGIVPNFSNRTHYDRFAYTLGSDEILLRWQAGYLTYPKLDEWETTRYYHTSFCYRVARDGRIDLYYKSVPNLNDEKVHNTEIYAGASNGFGSVMRAPIHTYQDLLDSVGDSTYAISFIPSTMPEQCEITSNGVLTAQSAVEGTWHIPVEVTDSRGQRFTTHVVLTVEEATSIKSSKHSVVPHLAVLKDQVSVRFPEDATLTLYQPNGRVLFQRSLQANRFVKFDLPELGYGVYLMRVQGREIRLQQKYLCQ